MKRSSNKAAGFRGYRRISLPYPRSPSHNLGNTAHCLTQRFLIPSCGALLDGGVPGVPIREAAEALAPALLPPPPPTHLVLVSGGGRGSGGRRESWGGGGSGSCSGGGRGGGDGVASGGDFFCSGSGSLARVSPPLFLSRS